MGSTLHLTNLGNRVFRATVGGNGAEQWTTRQLYSFLTTNGYQREEAADILEEAERALEIEIFIPGSTSCM
jgi:hypothetical protein